MSVPYVSSSCFNKHRHEDKAIDSALGYFANGPRITNLRIKVEAEEAQAEESGEEHLIDTT